MYYLRTKPAADAIQFTVDKRKFNTSQTNGSKQADEMEDLNEKFMNKLVCSLRNKEDCTMCGA